MKYHQTVLTASVVLSIVILVSAGISITITDVYEREAFNWKVQAVWQDYVDVFLIVPALLISGILVYYKKRSAGLIWAGTLLYLAYTYLIFCFDIHFNQFFLFYCVLLGGSVYTFSWFIYYSISRNLVGRMVQGRSLITATYLIVTGAVFYLLWLAEVTPSMLTNTTPAALEEFELPTNPVHVIDLSLLLPAYILTGIMMFMRIGIWQLLMPVLLVFGTLMGLTITGMQVLLFMRNMDGNLVVAGGMLSVAILNILLLYNNLRRRSHQLPPRNNLPE